VTAPHDPAADDGSYLVIFSNSKKLGKKEGTFDGMKRTLGLVLYLCLGIGIAPCLLCADTASAPESDIAATQSSEPSRTQSPSAPVEMDIRFGNGLRHDRLDWSTAGSGGHPNFVSELAWRKIYSLQWTLEGSLMWDRHAYIRGAVGYAAIQSGEVRDSDYDGDDRTLEFSRSISQTRDDNMWDCSFGAGPAFTLVQGRIILMPLLGFAVHSQNLRITDGDQEIATPGRTPPAGSISGLNSTYQTRWIGPWVGVDMKVVPQSSNPAIGLVLGLEYHFAVSYSADADWNLRSDLQHPVSFRHSADGTGFQLSSALLIQPHPRIDISVGMKYQHWTTSQGTSRIFRADGSVVVSQLNGVEWDCNTISVGVAYKF